MAIVLFNQNIFLGFTNDITCAGNEFDELSTSCEGDSGSPVIRRISGTARGNSYYQQEYVVSTGLDCNLKATIYTRVSNREILTWIQKITDTYPLVVVIGGYTRQIFSRTKGLTDRDEPGPDNDIEIISKNNQCKKGIRPADDGQLLCDWKCQKKTQNDPSVKPYIFNRADSIASTGQFTKDAPIYCGGKSKKENLDVCWEYDFKLNK